MWRSGKKPAKVRKSILPPSERQLFWAKEDRQANKTQFHYLESKWTSKGRSKVVEAEVPAAPDPSMPAWMNYRKTTKAPPIYFRTKTVTRSLPPKKPV